MLSFLVPEIVGSLVEERRQVAARLALERAALGPRPGARERLAALLVGVATKIHRDTIVRAASNSASRQTV
jgi:hypothetical protein